MSLLDTSEPLCSKCCKYHKNQMVMLWIQVRPKNSQDEYAPLAYEKLFFCRPCLVNVTAQFIQGLSFEARKEWIEFATRPYQIPVKQEAFKKGMMPSEPSPN